MTEDLIKNLDKPKYPIDEINFSFKSTAMIFNSLSKC